MSTLHQVREGVERFWESVSDGWQHMRERASHALTHFRPAPSDKDDDSTALARHAARWSVLAADVCETDRSLRVELEVPGMDAKNFDITIDDDVLIVRGEKRMARENTSGRFHVIERAYGSFERAIPLPTSVDEKATTARYKKGILHIELPKSNTPARRQIPIG